MGAVKTLVMEAACEQHDVLLAPDQRSDYAASAAINAMEAEMNPEVKKYVVVAMRGHSVKMVNGEPLIGTYERCVRYLAAMAERGDESWTFIPYNGPRPFTGPQGAAMRQKKEQKEVVIAAVDSVEAKALSVLAAIAAYDGK